MWGRNRWRLRGVLGISLVGLLASILPAQAGSLDRAAPSAESAFPGANGKIVFVAWDGLDNEIFSIEFNGTGLTQLTFNGVDDSDPTWSADGTKIAWISSYNIWKMAADGSAQVQVSNIPQAIYGVGWSPSGTKLVFSRDGAVDYDLFTMKANGTDIRRVTNTPVGENNPTWSPDGSRILYDRPKAGVDSVFTVRPDGSGTTRLTGSPGPAYAGSWSPNGRFILFASNPGGDYEIYRMRSDGSHQVQITNNTWDDEAPAYSPDGTRMAWSDRLDGDLEIVQAPISAPGSAVQLTFDATSSYQADWQPV